MGDAELIEASWQDPERFGELFERYYEMIFRYAVRAVGPSDGADVAAEVFTLAFESRTRFDPAYRSAGPWLFGIAANVVGEVLRRRFRSGRAFGRLSPPGSEPDTADGVADRVDAERTRPLLAAALGSLRPEELDVLLLAALGELSYPEIAGALGIPIGTVRSRLHRARQKLRNQIEPSDESITDDD